MIQKKLSLFFCLLLAPCCVSALTITGVQIMDSGRSARTSFYNTETITLKIDCYNDTTLANNDRVWFKFYVYDPMGMQVFYHEGNSMMGTLGMGGSELRSFPISFYTIPGDYTFKGEAIAGSAAGSPSVSQTIKFTLTSSGISLTYPPNGTRDIPSTPLIFRWAASGASKYRVSVADNASFYRPLWTDESYISEIMYPENPSDTLAKLASGPLYWWKVDGMDISGKIIAITPIPFSFTVKDMASNSKDLAVENIALVDRDEEESKDSNKDSNKNSDKDKDSNKDSNKGSNKNSNNNSNNDSNNDSNNVKVYVTNFGNEAQSNVNLDIVVAGGAAIPTITIKTIEQRGQVVIPVDVGPVAGEGITISATINVMDDNPKNNTLTKVLKYKEKRGKILGAVLAKLDKKPIAGAIVEYTGASNGKVKTNSGGQYKIEKLPYGSYTLNVSHSGYISSDYVKVALNKQNANPNIIFGLSVRGAGKEEKEEGIGMDEVWSGIKGLIKDKKVLDELDGYNVIGIETGEAVDLVKLMEKFKAGKATIIEATVEKE